MNGVGQDLKQKHWDFQNISVNNIHSKEVVLSKNLRKPHLIGEQYQNISTEIQLARIQSIERENLYQKKLQGIRMSTSSNNSVDNFRNSGVLRQHISAMEGLGKDSVQNSQNVSQSNLSQKSLLMFKQQQLKMGIERIKESKPSSKRERAKQKDVMRSQMGSNFDLKLRKEQQLSKNSSKNNSRINKSDENRYYTNESFDQIKSDRKNSPGRILDSSRFKNDITVNKSSQRHSQLRDQYDEKLDEEFYSMKRLNYMNYKYRKPTENVSSLFDISLIEQEKLQPTAKTQKTQNTYRNSSILEDTINNLSNQKFLRKTQDEMSDEEQGGLEKQKAIQKWKDDLRQKEAIKQIELQNPFIVKDRIKKNLDKLEKGIVNKKLHTQSQKLIKGIQKYSQKKSWLPPLQQYRIQQAQTIIQDPKLLEQGNQELYINVLHMNKAFEGAQSTLKCYFDEYPRTHYQTKNQSIQEKPKIMNKKYRSNLIIEEFNKLLLIDEQNKLVYKKQVKNLKIDQKPRHQRSPRSKIGNNNISAIERNKGDSRIQRTGIYTLNDNEDSLISKENNKDIVDKFVLKQTFINSHYFVMNIRQDNKEIIDRVVYAIENKDQLITFESFKLFFKLFVFREAKWEEKEKFLKKFFRGVSRTFYMKNFMQIIDQLCKLQDGEELKRINRKQFEIQLEKQENLAKMYYEQLSIQYDPNDDDEYLDEESIAEIFFNEVVDPDSILALICRMFYQNY